MADLDLAPIGLAQFPDRILQSVMDNWRARRVELGRSPAAEVPILVQCYIADSDEEARAQARQYLPLYFKKQVEHYEILKDPWKDTEGYEQFSRMFSTLLKLSNSTDIDAFIDLNAIGSPATVERRIRELMDIGFNHFLMTNSTPGVPKTVRHSMLKRLASDVMPRFSSRSKAA